MTTVERTRQQLDPAGSTGVAPVTVALSVGAIVYAVVMTLRGASEISNPVLGGLALALLAGAVAVLIRGSASSRAPLTARTHAVATIVAWGAILCESISQWGTNAYIRDDWGPVTLGIIMVALGPYRPARQIAASGIASAVGVGILTYIEVPSLVTPGPPLAFVVLGVTPLLALTFSGAAFSNGLVSSIERWHTRAEVASAGIQREFREGIARSVQQDRVTILSRDVLPFFAEMLARDEVTEVDRVRAREIADAIRRVMVEEVDRTWLEKLIELLGAEHSNRWGAAKGVVDDQQRRAAAMTTGQRTAMRALLVALCDFPDLSRTDLRIAITGEGGESQVVLSARMPLNEFAMRHAFAPFFAVMRAVFTRFDAGYSRNELTLRFSYDHN